MEDPNALAVELVDEVIDFAGELRVDVSHLDTDAVVLDFGVDAAGGLEAGLLLAEVATGGLATLGARLGTVDGIGLTHVEVSTDHPVLALTGCQAPGWEITAGGFEWHAAGPARLLTGETGLPGFDADDPSGFAVVVLEADRLPGAGLSQAVAEAAGVPTSAVFVLVAPANSPAGTVAASARVAERAVARYAALGADPSAVRSVSAAAPTAPLAAGASEARARSMAAVAGGGRAHLVATAPVDEPDRLAGARPDDVAPAQVTLDLVGGPVHAVGGVDEGRLAGDLGL